MRQIVVVSGSCKTWCFSGIWSLHCFTFSWSACSSLCSLSNFTRFRGFNSSCLMSVIVAKYQNNQHSHMTNRMRIYTCERACVGYTRIQHQCRSLVLRRRAFFYFVALGHPDWEPKADDKTDDTTFGVIRWASGVGGCKGSGSRCQNSTRWPRRLAKSVYLDGDKVAGNDRRISVITWSDRSPREIWHFDGPRILSSYLSACCEVIACALWYTTRFFRQHVGELGGGSSFQRGGHRPPLPTCVAATASRVAVRRLISTILGMWIEEVHTILSVDSCFGSDSLFFLRYGPPKFWGEMTGARFTVINSLFINRISLNFETMWVL